jgi:hypothetical protein
VVRKEGVVYRENRENQTRPSDSVDLVADLLSRIRNQTIAVCEVAEKAGEMADVWMRSIHSGKQAQTKLSGDWNPAGWK